MSEGGCPSSHNTQWQGDLSMSYEKVGDVLKAQGKLDEALKAYRDSLAIRERLAAADRSNATQSVSRRCPGWREIDRLGEPSEHGKRLRPPRGFIFSLVDPLRSKVAALRGTALCLQSPRSRSA
jgi:hypothetical protein